MLWWISSGLLKPESVAVNSAPMVPSTQTIMLGGGRDVFSAYMISTVEITPRLPLRPL
jgi:hypothetical protein